MSDWQNRLRRGLRFVFGHYSPPGFAVVAVGWVRRVVGELVRRRPAVFGAILGSILFVLAAGAGIRMWWLSRPQPSYTEATLQAPPTRAPVADAPLPVLEIRFLGSTLRADLVGRAVTSGITLKPEIAGEWKAEDDRNLVFRPQTDWPIGQKYVVRVAREVLAPHVLLRKYDLEFSTEPFSASISGAEFHIHPTDARVKQVAVTVAFSHPVDPASLESNVGFSVRDRGNALSDREWKISVSYDPLFREAYILSESLPVPDRDVRTEVKVNQGVRSAQGGGGLARGLAAEVVVPGLNSYIQVRSVTETMVRNARYELEQVLVVETRGQVSGADLARNTEVWLLPKDRPAAPGVRPVTNFRWQDPAMVGPEVLAVSQRVDLQPIAGEHDHESLTSFRIKADPGRQLYVRIARGTPFFGDYVLGKEHTAIVAVQPFPREVRILHEGAILSMSGEKRLSLLSQGVPGVRFEIGRIIPDQINHLVSQSNGDVSRLQFASYGSFGEENITDRFEETLELQGAAAAETQYFSFDFARYLRPQREGRVRHGLFMFRVREWNPLTREAGRASAARLIMVTDLGILAKSNVDGTRDLFVQSLAGGKPVGGATVEVIGKNGIAIHRDATAADGHVRLPPLDGFRAEKQPVAFVVRAGDDLSFLPYQARGRWLDFTDFDTGGVHGATVPDRLTAFLFTDRGIYRPGDELHVGMIVRSGDWDRAIGGTPLEAVVTDPRGLAVHARKLSVGRTGFDELAYTTETTAPTGTYQVNLYTIDDRGGRNLLGSTSARVEEFLPDRLRISSSLSGPGSTGWVSPDRLTVLVSLQNLYGTPAAGHRIKARLSLSPGFLRFRGFSDYSFQDPLAAEKGVQEDLADAITDEKGRAEIDLGLRRFTAATYTMRLSVTGLEKEGGRGVRTESVALVSPLPYLIGTRADGDLRFIFKGSARTVHYIGVSPELSRIAVGGLTLTTYEKKYLSVLTRAPNGTFQYQSIEKKEPLSTQPLSVPVDGYRHSIATDRPGDYELALFDAEGRELSRIAYSVAGAANLARSLDRTAELQIKLDREDYKPGEQIQVAVKAPYAGSGLLTIEGDRVYAYRWFASGTTASILSIVVPDDLEGSAYVNVSYVRAPDSPEIYMSPLSYAAAPFSVSRARRTVAIDLDVAEEARPGQPLSIRYRVSRPSAIAIFAVDEGILQVARYEAPDPLGFFFRKRALEVRTAQILDLLLPEFSVVKRVTATGGDESADDLAHQLNPFRRKQYKPVAYWSGILDATPSGGVVRYDVPDYFNGRLRVMAVAVAADALGAVSRTSTVRGPFVISPNAPLFAAPGDELTVSVAVANNVRGSGAGHPVELTVSPSAAFEFADPSVPLRVDEGRDETARFRLKVKEILGPAELRFTASDGREQSSLAAFVSVRPPVPYQTSLQAGILKSGRAEVKVERSLRPELRRLEATVSYLPLGLANGLQGFLKGYPYGCTEQILSQAVPALVLEDEALGLPREERLRRVYDATGVLQARQNAEGGFGVWAANSSASDFYSAYAVHFLTEAAERGIPVPEAMLQKGLLKLREVAGRKVDSFWDLQTQAYAIYLLTRNGTVTADLIAPVRERLGKTGEDWKSSLSAIYLAASYRLMEDSREAARLLGEVRKSVRSRDDEPNHHNRLIRDAQYLYVLSRHFPDAARSAGADLIQSMADELEGGRFNTIASAYTIMALEAYSKAAGRPAAGRIGVSEVLQDNAERALELSGKPVAVALFSDQARAIRIENAEGRPLFFQVLESGFDRALPVKPSADRLEVTREITGPDGSSLSRITLGAEVAVHLKVRSTDRTTLDDVAIVDLLPAGLEVDLASIRERGAGRGGGDWKPDHIDVREDRVIFFGSVGKDLSEIVYRARAVNSGRFAVPPAYGESMYDRKVRAVRPAGSIEIGE